MPCWTSSQRPTDGSAKSKLVLRRGFKSEANWLARDVRRSIGVPDIAPLPPAQLAQHLEIDVLPLSALAADCPMAVRHLGLGRGLEEFSAVTVHRDGRRLVVHNDHHHPNRQAANIAHELAHALLHHPPHGLLGTQGERTYERVMEAEANWLGPALLVSEEAALWIVEEDLSVPRASAFFRVSKAVIEMRLRAVAARKRIAARRAKAA